jgi:hypothetical protein
VISQAASRAVAPELSAGGFSLGDDPVGRLAYPAVVSVIVCSLYHNVSDVDHRDPAEPIAVALDVIPTDRTVLWHSPYANCSHEACRAAAGPSFWPVRLPGCGVPPSNGTPRKAACAVTSARSPIDGTPKNVRAPGVKTSDISAHASRRTNAMRENLLGSYS